MTLMFNIKFKLIFVPILMGIQCCAAEIPRPKRIKESETINKSSFTLEYPIGKGYLGRVWKVKFNHTGEYFAMKQISKVKAYVRGSLGSILIEEFLLKNLYSPFISNLRFSFQDEEFLYLLQDYLPGGDLRYYLNQKISFNEEQIRFFVSNIVVALSYLHKQNIVHRDIKPENLIFDNNGYLILTDLGIACMVTDDRLITENSGTPGYMAPETIKKSSQTFATDFFSLGVLTYELIYNKRPFRGRDSKEIKNNTLYTNIYLDEKTVPNGFSKDIADFVNKLLIRKPTKRLGAASVDEIKEHSFFKDFDWAAVEAMSAKAPFVPRVGDNFNYKNVNKIDPYKIEHYDSYLDLIKKKNYIQNFYFNSYDIVPLPSLTVKLAILPFITGKHGAL